MVPSTPLAFGLGFGLEAIPRSHPSLARPNRRAAGGGEGTAAIPLVTPSELNLQAAANPVVGTRHSPSWQASPRRCAEGCTLWTDYLYAGAAEQAEGDAVGACAVTILWASYIALSLLMLEKWVISEELCRIRSQQTRVRIAPCARPTRYDCLSMQRPNRTNAPAAAHDGFTPLRAYPAYSPRAGGRALSLGPGG
jgi:hypothetical protein